MRFNGKLYKQIMNEREIKIEEVSYKTGLLQNSVEWILDRGFASDEAMERLAAVVNMEVGAFFLPDVTGTEENVIEFLKDSGRAVVTFSQGRYKTRIKKLARSHPEQCRLIVENQDGSIYAHIPVAWVKINPTKKITEAQLEARRKNISNCRTVARQKE